MRTALAVAHEPADAFAVTFADFRRHLQLVSYQAPAPVITQPPGLADAWMLAAMNAVYAAVLVWQALRLTAIAAPDACRRTLLAATRPLPLIGVCGWAYATILTALLIWG